jgi:predicted Rossmann fold flavoprotein
VVVEELHNKNKVEVVIDLKPALDEQKLDNRLIRDLDEHGNKKLLNIFRLWLPASMIPIFVDLLNIDTEKVCNQVSSKERKQILYLLKNISFKISGHRSFKEAIITSGGISTKEISQKTMESKVVKGLYFAGEIINLDAETGGYNLQIAYSTGWLAGNSCMKDKN